MWTKEIGNLLGLANISRNIITGEKVLESIQKQKAKLIIIASDASDNTKKKYHDKCKYYSINCIELGTSEQISHAIGKENRMAIALMDENFAKKILEKSR